MKIHRSTMLDFLISTSTTEYLHAVRAKFGEMVSCVAGGVSLWFCSRNVGIKGNILQRMLFDFMIDIEMIG